MINFFPHHIKSAQQLRSIIRQTQRLQRLAKQFELHSELQKYGPSKHR